MEKRLWFTTMGSSFILFVTLITSLCSPGSPFQAQHLPNTPDSFKIPQIHSGSVNDVNNVTGEAISQSESFEEGSGFNADGVNSPQLSNNNRNPKEPERVSNENHSGPGITLTTRPALRVQSSEVHNQGADKADSITGSTHSSVSSEEAHLEHSHITEKQLKRSQSIFLTRGNNPRIPVQTSVFTFLNNPSLSHPGGPCVLGVTPCTVFNSFNGTTLLWDDMKRTLAFSWELHVFGSAGLFALMVVLGVLGMARACTLPRPLSDSLTLSNVLLVFSGALRTILLLLDPYGTRQILPHATLVALHNVPLQLLLWSQVVLAVVTLKGLKLILFPIKLQYPWLIGWLSVSHCAALVAADLYPTLPPALPLLLQTLSLCWGIPFCFGILTTSLSNIQSIPSSTFPQWVPSQRTGRLGKRVIAVCAFLGLLCCSLQMYSLLWLYGLLGNWRRFGWGWWLTQFWARILELAWGFSMLFLGSWIFWTPSRGHARGNHWQGRNELSKRVEKKSLWGKIMASMQKGSLRKSEKSWEELMPNNWAKYNLSRAGISNAMYDNEPDTIISEYSPDAVGDNSDAQTAFLWQKVGDQECVLSLIEFDMQPPSPINLRHSIDNALYHGQLVSGGVFIPPPPSWTQSTGADGGSSTTTFPPAYVGYKWMLDTESISASLDHFQTKEPAQSVNATPDYDDSIGSPAAAQDGEEFSAAIHQHDWSEDDITDL